jgi:hypothetical protein
MSPAEGLDRPKTKSRPFKLLGRLGCPLASQPQRGDEQGIFVAKSAVTAIGSAVGLELVAERFKTFVRLGTRGMLKHPKILRGRSSSARHLMLHHSQPGKQNGQAADFYDAMPQRRRFDKIGPAGTSASPSAEIRRSPGSD